ncbi:Transposable element tcb2 transposase [Caligus rogercresseyi]|uniref:Transposable element tcb2 transposase n=1 Tax=Caligus rogercresseyi TaxID=217165 RepID=A0A7T8HF34_CALRO|nr:Transposable element tcb2 transposase [Caligus rogercresseyi]
MSSELEHRTAIIMALRCGRAPKEIIDFFKFPMATVYSIAKSFKELEDIEEGFLTPERKTPDRSQVRKSLIASLLCQGPKCQQGGLLGRHADCGEALDDPIAAGRPYLYQQDGAPAHTSNLVQNWCLENLDMFWSKEFWPPSSLDLNPCDYYLWGVLERDTNKRADNTVDSLKAAIIQAVANLSREQVAHAVGRFRHRVEVVIVKGGSWIE